VPDDCPRRHAELLRRGIDAAARIRRGGNDGEANSGHSRRVRGIRRGYVQLLVYVLALPSEVQEQVGAALRPPQLRAELAQWAEAADGRWHRRSAVATAAAREWALHLRAQALERGESAALAAIHDELDDCLRTIQALRESGQ
jgi:hypothetical protein